jgi:hypothetical protein
MKNGRSALEQSYSQKTFAFDTGMFLSDTMCEHSSGLLADTAVVIVIAGVFFCCKADKNCPLHEGKA